MFWEVKIMLGFLASDTVLGRHMLALERQGGLLPVAALSSDLYCSKDTGWQYHQHGLSTSC